MTEQPREPNVDQSHSAFDAGSQYYSPLDRLTETHAADCDATRIAAVAAPDGYAQVTVKCPTCGLAENLRIMVTEKVAVCAARNTVVADHNGCVAWLRDCLEVDTPEFGDIEWAKARGTYAYNGG